jgi:hypothetical protein
VYAYAGVSPIEGEMDWMVSQKMNTEQMSVFLCESSSNNAPYMKEIGVQN